jgi:hypothetical protein
MPQWIDTRATLASPSCPIRAAAHQIEAGPRGDLVDRSGRKIA